jgi:hypothetical protein
MKLLILLLLTSAIVFSAERYDERVLKVNPGGTLDIDLASSDIIINTWNRNEIQFRTGEDESLQIKYSSSRVVVRAGRTNQIITLSVNMPAHFNIDINTSAGDHIINGNIKGNLKIRNSGGDVTFNDVNGSVFVRMGGGDLSGHDISGSVKIESYGGDISLSAIKGRTYVVTGGGNIKINSSKQIEKIKSTGGNLLIKEASGNGEITTGGGNIDIGTASGNLKINTFGGDIKISETSGRIIAKTSGGIIRIKEVSGSIDAHTGAGDIYVNFSSQAKNSSLSTGNGNIRVGVAGNLSANIKAKMKDPEWWKNESGSDEVIKSDFKLSSFQRNKAGQEVTAVYETGGSRSSVNINLETNYGDIFIKKGN